MSVRSFAEWCLAVGLFLSSGGTAAWAAELTNPAYAHPQRMVEVEAGRRLNLYCQGHGAPTVVFVSGLAEEMTPWGLVQPMTARKTQACAYDRAGTGFSNPGPRGGGAAEMAEDIHRLLQAAHIPPPYVLVGHSYGGLAVRYYASVHSSEVAGLVLVDTTLEDEAADKFKVQPDFGQAFLEPQYAALRACAAAARRGLKPGTKPYGECVASPNPRYSTAINAALQANHRRAAFQQAVLSEDMAAASGVSGDQVRKVRQSLGDLPLVVLTAPYHPSGPLPPGIRPEVRVAMTELYATGPDRVAALSTRGVHRIVPDTGHYIQLDRPDVVAAAIEEVLEEAAAPKP